MRPLTLSLSGFRSYRDPQTVDFAIADLACITGRNGAGKSSLFDAMAAALFGGMDAAAVNDTCERAEVSLCFEHDGQTWRVTRSRGARARAKSTAVIERDDGEGFVAVAEGTTEVDRVVRELLGLSKEIFAATVLLAQGDAGRFPRADPRDRKAILARILRLERYEEAAAEARARQRDAAGRARHHDSHAADLDQRAAAAEADAAQLDGARAHLDRLQDSSRQLAGELAAAQQALQAAQAAHARAVALYDTLRDAADQRAATARQAADDAKRELDGARAHLARCARQASHARQAAAELDTAAAKVDEWRRQAEQIARARDETMDAGHAAKADSELAQAEIERRQAALDDARARHESLSRPGAECFVCGTPLAEHRRGELLDAAGAEIDGQQVAIERLRAKVADAEERRGRLRRELTELDAKAKRVADGLAKAQEQLAGLTAAAERLPEIEAELDRAQAAVTAWEARERQLAADSATDDSELAAAAAEVERTEAALGPLAQAVDAAATKAAELDAERDRLNRRIGELTARAGHAAELRADAEKARAEHAAALADERDFAVLSQAFGPDGVPNLVMAGVVEALERSVNELMDVLADGQFQVALRTERSSADGQSVSALDVVVTTADGERPYSTLSGGERFRVDLALRVGLARLLAGRGGGRIEFLALDEGWGELDPEGVAAMLDVLRGLGQEFGLVLTVTHTPEVAAAFGTRFEIERDTDGTSVVRPLVSA
ncbi:MAG TPA: SMC family ATPase [Acidimicrobiales bacterium]|nr:SMC family ATPase [Acidimicrobiales bacterium]